jgi:hypothetical protein
MKNLIYRNTNAIRNKPITPKLFREISDGISRVYGPDVQGVIYSGGQDSKGKGTRRTGSIRHDKGHAADVHLYRGNTLITGIELALFAQYWAAMAIGGVGLEMVGGGIHIDQWKVPPAGGGMYWSYPNGAQNSIVRKTQKSMVQSGLNGNMPELFRKPKVNPFTMIFNMIMELFNGFKK